MTVTFNAIATGGIEPYHYLWTFGDGQTSTEKAPIHIYSAAGRYQVTLSVTCSCQPPHTVHSQEVITVQTGSSPLKASFVYSPAVSAEAGIGVASGP